VSDEETIIVPSARTPNTNTVNAHWTLTQTAIKNTIYNKNHLLQPT